MPYFPMPGPIVPQQIGQTRVDPPTGVDTDDLCYYINRMRLHLPQPVPEGVTVVKLYIWHCGREFYFNRHIAPNVVSLEMSMPGSRHPYEYLLFWANGPDPNAPGYEVSISSHGFIYSLNSHWVDLSTVDWTQVPEGADIHEKWESDPLSPKNLGGYSVRSAEVSGTMTEGPTPVDPSAPSRPTPSIGITLVSCQEDGTCTVKITLSTTQEGCVKRRISITNSNGGDVYVTDIEPNVISFQISSLSQPVTLNGSITDYYPPDPPGDNNPMITVSGSCTANISCGTLPVQREGSME